ncbi:ribonuclease H-like domain-containing protein [Tanacetum coccineum]
MRNKPRVDTLSFDDLYNNLRVFKSDVKGSTASSSSTQNVAFVSSESINSTNDVSTAYGVSTSSGYNSQRENSSSYTDELMCSFFANQSSGPQLDHEDLEQLDEVDLEEMDLKWQVAMISKRLKKFYKKTKRKLSKGNHDVRRREVRNNRYKAKDNERRSGKQEELNDWTGHVKDEQENFALIAYSNSGSDTKVTSCSKVCKESYAKLKKLYDEQRDQLGDASIEIKAYTLALKKVEAQLVTHQQNQLWYEEKIKFMKIDLDEKTNVLTYHKKLLAQDVKEKEELLTKLEKWQNSSKGLNILLASQMSAKDKSGLGYGNHIHEGVLSYENEVFGSVFDSRSSVVEDSPVNDRFAQVEGMHVVPPPMTGNYMPPKSNFGIDNKETLESVPEPVVNEPKVVSQPKVWTNAPNIEEYNFGHLIRDCDFHEKRMAKQVELNKKQGKGTSQGENRPMWNNVQRLNHQNKFVPTVVLTKTGRFPVNTARQNFTSQAASTSTARKVNTARQNFTSQATSTSTARKVNTVRPIANKTRPRNNCYKSHSPIRRPFYKTTTPRTNFSNHKVYTTRDKAVSAVRGKGKTVVKTSADNPQKALKNKGIGYSGCSRHMIGNKAYLAEYQDYNGGLVAFGGSKGYITGKGKIRIGKLDFKNVCFVKELQHFNLFFILQMCDKKNKVLFTNTKYLVLSPEFKLPDENQVLLKIPRQNNMHSFNIENIIPSGGLACLIAKAIIDESNKWHRRLGHVNFKNLNKLVMGNLVRCLPSKIFQNDHTCVPCQKGKQHKASSEPAQEYYVLPLWSSYTSTVKSSETKNGGEKPKKDTNLKSNEKPVDKEEQAFLGELERLKRQEKDTDDAAEALRKEFSQNTEDLLLQATADRATSTKIVNTVNTPVNTASSTRIFLADFTNLETTVNIEPKKISEALKDKSWVDAMQEELLQFKIQKVWILVDLPFGKNEIGTKWVYMNKKDERGVVVRNKARLVAQGHRQEEGIDYDEVFALVARIKVIRIFLAFASYMGFIVYQMDVKSTFLYGKIDKEVYVSQPPGFVDPKYPKKVYKVVKALYGLHQAPRAWYATLSTFLVKSRYRRGTIDKTLFIKKDKNDIMLVQEIHNRRLSISWQETYLMAVQEANNYGYFYYRGINPVFHSKAKHIEIRHHFIRDAYEKKLIQVLKIHTDDNVVDLLTKAFNGRKKAKPRPTLDVFDDLDADGWDYMETKDVVIEGRQSNETDEELVSIAIPETVRTARPDVNTASQEKLLRGC